MKQLDESRIALLFERYSPKPSAAFYTRPFPWKGRTSMKTYPLPRLVAGTLSVLVALALVILLVPPLNSLAQDAVNLLAHYQSDTRDDQPPNPAPAGAPVTVPLVGADAVAQAEAQAGFAIPAPTFMPDFLTLARASAAGNVLLDYADANGNTVVSISILPIAQPFESFVGASAPIETLTVGDVSAQYVEGLWMGQEGQPEMTWFQTPTVQNLTWWKNGQQVEITVTNAHTTLVRAVTKDELIAIARSMVEQQ